MDGVGRVCKSCYDRLRVQGKSFDISALKRFTLQSRKEIVSDLEQIDQNIGGSRLLVGTFSRRSKCERTPYIVKES
jgi:hypothetical protein